MSSELKEKSEKFRERLLDLSGRNNFIKYNHRTASKNSNKQRFLRFVNEVPELLIKKLRKTSRYQLKAKSPQANYDFNLPFITPKTASLYKVTSKSIQVYEEDTKFNLSCNTIRLESNSFEKDKGINVLYVAIGFLKYPPKKGVSTKRKSTDPNKKQETKPKDPYAYAPLILYPVKLTREKTASGFNYFLESGEEELIINRSLKAKLIKEEGISFPELKYENEDTPLVEKYFKDINNALLEKNEIEGTNKWELKRWASLGIFKFGKLAIFEDINFDSWSKNPLLEKQLVKDFINGVPSNSIEDIGDMEIFQDKFEKVQLLDQVPKLIAEADSTQYKVIVKALEGKSMAIQGPPGTGKSQTITNIIGGLMVKNKKILFAADKFAALEVVKQRLTKKNLGSYILELHNATKSKREFHENIISRLGKPKKRFSRDSYKDDFDQLKNLRRKLNEHVETINKNLDLNGQKTNVFDLIWKDIVNKINLEQNENAKDIKEFQDKFLTKVFSKIDKENIATVKSTLDTLSDLSNKSTSEEFLELSQINGLPETEDELAKLIRISKKIIEFLKGVEKSIIEKDLNHKNILNLSKEKLDKEINNFEELISERYINNQFTITEDISEKLSNIYKFVVEKEDKESYIEEWAKPFLENQSKFDIFEDCLKEIEIIKIQNSRLKISEIIDDLKILYESISKVIREISKEDRRLNKIINFKDLINGIGFYKRLTDKYFDNYEDILLLLKNTEDSSELKQVINQLKQIQKNNKQGLNLIKKDIDIKKIRDIGPERLKEFSEIIKNAPLFGCLFNKEVRNVKSSWKSISKAGSKRPKLSEMAKLYLVASDYCSNIDKEDFLRSNNFDIDLLRDLSFKFQFENDLENLLIEIKSQFKEPSEFEIISKIFETNKSNFIGIQFPVFDNFLDNNLIQVQELTKTYATNIFTRLTLLGESPSKNLLETRFSNLGMILEDIKNLKKIINNLGLTIKESGIYCEENLEYSLSSNDINRLLELFGNIDISNYINLTSQKINKFTLSEILNFLKEISLYLSDLQKISVYFEEDILNSYLEGNINNQDYLVDLESLKLNLINLVKIETSLESFIEFTRLKNDISNLGFKKGIDQLLEISKKSKIKASDIFEYLYIKNKIKEIELEKKINKFSGKGISICKDVFCEVDMNFIEKTSFYIDNYLDKNLDRLLVDSQVFSKSPKDLREGNLINHEVTKKRNHLPYRKFFNQALISLQRLKPCFMMSPSSAAQCLPKKIDIFDVLIIDEASQMHPEEALGLIARCKQVIIVGDEKQLPPDNRWLTRDDDDDDDYEETVELEVNESILELANKVLKNTRDCSLGWHYRSRHNSLIDFSNKNFYNDELTVFPANKIGSEIHLVPVENPYYHQRRNLPEVNTVIDTLRKQIIEDPSKTILIASINSVQASEIQIALDNVRNKEKIFNDYISRHKGTLEELMVKNLENVQGDERDIVIISTVYGPNENGVVKNTFGDVVKAGGERRLNVLLTRAKHKVFLVTSLKSTDIKDDVSKLSGKRYLKDYLFFAETGKLSNNLVRHSGEPENCFEEAIMNSLIKRGYQVDAQVGCAEYRIDLAIRDPRDTSRYLLAVECDGASYHTEYSARVNDRLRQQVLEGLGWNVFRIWSTDWWRTPEQELILLDQKIEELTSLKKEEENLTSNI